MLQLDLDFLQLCWLIGWMVDVLWGLDCPEINPVPVAYQRLNGSWVCAAGYAGSVQVPNLPVVNGFSPSASNDVPQSICLSKVIRFVCQHQRHVARWIATSAATALRNRAWKDATRRTLPAEEYCGVPWSKLAMSKSGTVQWKWSLKLSLWTLIRWWSIAVVNLDWCSKTNIWKLLCRNIKTCHIKIITHNQKIQTLHHSLKRPSKNISTSEVQSKWYVFFP